MYRQENSTIMSLYAISSVHAGSGTSMGVVDLPIQRERHTQWPHIQASGVKGAMRHHFETFKHNIGTRDKQVQMEKITEKIFGSENFGEEGTLPGAIAVSDAKLLAFPIRSSRRPFVWITCPAVLQRLEKDLCLTAREADMRIPSLSGNEAMVINGTIPVGEELLLEDYEVVIAANNCEFSQAAQALFKKAGTLLLVSNETYHYGVTACTEVRTQIKIDSDSGTTAKGSLRYEEVLPADTLMYVVLFYGSTRDADSTIPAEILITYMQKDVIPSHIQMGGDETLGCGLFQVEWI